MDSVNERRKLTAGDGKFDPTSINLSAKGKFDKTCMPYTIKLNNKLNDDSFYIDLSQRSG